ncbi:hypothetical protein N7517_002142 [Penicillium concentricum]|uniref:Uncharacterized protein n=1 Tax=Penicillium concentricum TaxID=293559 RepID=A0A9W9STI4_9EURO|nr:uncharacterized protein N7517_002142 [Penicillium concentricum]KAJ5384231.1 hypothetical protein N7517_002142 [Penicillium concentricum]
MTRRSRKASCQSSSDSEYSEREGTEDCGSDTDLTEPEDEAYQPCNAGDASLLFADNEYTAEYYIQQLQNFDETVYTQEDYGKGTTALLNRIEEKWSQLVLLSILPLPFYWRLLISLMYHQGSAVSFGKIPTRNTTAYRSRFYTTFLNGLSIYDVVKMGEGFQESSAKAPWIRFGKYFG